MATTFSERKVALDEIATRIRTNAKRLADAKNQATVAESDLTAMATVYTTIVADINADATANPSNSAYTTMKAEKDVMVAEFTTLKTLATNVKTAIINAGG